MMISNTIILLISNVYMYLECVISLYRPPILGYYIVINMIGGLVIYKVTLATEI